MSREENYEVIMQLVLFPDGQIAANWCEGVNVSDLIENLTKTLNTLKDIQKKIEAGELNPDGTNVQVREASSN